MPRTLLLIFMLAAACSPGGNADREAPDAAAKAVVKLYAFECGHIDVDDLSVFLSGDEFQGRKHSLADSCFLIRHPDGDLLWDTGLPDALHDEENGVTNGPFRLTVPRTLASQLAELGLTPDDIEFLSLSHSHLDHAGNAGAFATSTFLVEKDERAYMFDEEARADAESFALIAPLENAETIEFDGDYDVFGDGSVMIIATPGHTPGHTSLLVNLVNSGPVLLTGDLYHLIKAREKRIVPSINTDAEQTLASMDKFEALAEKTGARVVIQHSQEHFDSLPKPPAYLD